jgi:hypothetical protein
LSPAAIIGATAAAVIFIAGRYAVHTLIGRILSSPEALEEGAWQHDLYVQATRNRPRLEANLYYLFTMGAIGVAVFIAAVATVAPLGLGLLGLAMSVVASVLAGARVRYGSGSLADAWRVVRSWIRHS